VPSLVGSLDVQLHERAGQFFILPWRRRFAGTESNDRVTHPDGLARLQSQVANDSVPLVQKPQYGDALGHRSDVHVLTRSGARRRQSRAICLLLGLIATPARRQRQ
jgi:hypothetical protein